MPDRTPQSYYQSEAALKRLRRRRRAEWRLQACGIGAIALAGLALTALLWSVISKAGDALSETYLALPVTLDAAEIDPQASADPARILQGNFTGLARQALKARFEGVRGRKVKRQLHDLLSSGASFELARHVADNPDLIGRTITFDFLASDTTDLYLKGAFGRLEPLPAAGALVLAEEGRTTLRLDAGADAFVPVLERLGKTLRAQAERLRTTAARETAGAESFARLAETAASPDARAEARAEADMRRARAAALRAQAAVLDSRAAGDGIDDTALLPLDDRMPSVLVEIAGGWIKLTAVAPRRAEGEILVLPDRSAVGGAAVSGWQLHMTESPESARKVSDRQIVWIESLRREGAVKQRFNTRFFFASDSREPELAGIRGAVVGTFWTMLVTFALAFPIGVFAAIYLEEFAPKNRLTRFIEVNINNLAAVPSIVFGLLGLALFLGVFGVPRSAPLAGGMVLALMTLPTIIIAARAALRAVPPSIREAALGVGASRLQATFHHVLPLAMPGILTGTIIGMAQALGETAPLILIGMVAFIVDVPQGITDSATVLPVQIFRWSDFPERAFEARAAAAILVLLGFLMVMNGLAIVLRKRFERRW